MERRLTAILAADVAEYSRHTEEDDEASTAILEKHLTLVRESIAAHQGQPFTLAGDGIIAEFSSVVEAVRCAIEIQNKMAEGNASIPEKKRMQFRIGVNLSDVISKDNNCYGTGVNVAVRLEQLAQPGGICISQTVYDQVRKIVEMPIEDIGERHLKNIADPVHVYRILPAPLPWYKKLWPHAGVYLRGSTVAALIFLLIFGVAAGVSYYLREPGALWSTLLPDLRPKSIGIAVLPFQSLGDNPEGKDFARGLTGDILTELSRRRDLRVIRHTGESANTGYDASAPKVDYVLEGTIRPQEDELIRVNPTLLKVDGQLVWAHNFDRKMTERFYVDDEIVCHIVASIAGGYGAIESTQAESATQKSPGERPVDELVASATAAMQHEWTKEKFDEARGLLNIALQLDPNSRPARRELAFYDLMARVFELDIPPVSLQQIATDASDILSLDPKDGRARMLVATTHFFSEERKLSEERKTEELERFEKEATQAITDAPCDPQVLAILGALLSNSGEWSRGVSLVKRANELNRTAAEGWFHSTMYLNYYLNGGHYTRALNMMRASPDFPTRENLNGNKDPVPYAIYDYIALCGQLDSKKHIKCGYKTNELSAEEAWRWLAKSDCKWIEAEWDDSSNKCLKKGVYASRESIENWYKEWNFLEKDIHELMEGVDASGVLGMEAAVQPVADH